MKLDEGHGKFKASYSYTNRNFVNRLPCCSRMYWKRHQLLSWWRFLHYEESENAQAKV